MFDRGEKRPPANSARSPGQRRATRIVLLVTVTETATNNPDDHRASLVVHKTCFISYAFRNMTGTRIDKWLWAARFYKTRALAAKACELNRVQASGQRAKPAREVKVGDMLQVSNDSGDFEVEVLLLSEVRGPAAVAATLYRETDESKLRRQRLHEEQQANRQFNVAPQTRPSKRDRRRIIQFRGGR